MRVYFLPALSRSQLHIYERYVHDISDLLRNCIRYFKRDEIQMKTYYEKHLRELSTELKRYQQSNGDSGASGLMTQQAFIDIMKWVLSGEKARTDLISSTLSYSKFTSAGVDKTHKISDVPTDLRHKSETNDLQTTCSALEIELRSEIERLRAENEALRTPKFIDADNENKHLKEQIELLKTELCVLQARDKTDFIAVLTEWDHKDTQTMPVEVVSGDSMEAGDSKNSRPFKVEKKLEAMSVSWNLMYCDRLWIFATNSWKCFVAKKTCSQSNF